jgi:uncharacterized protein YegL
MMRTRLTKVLALILALVMTIGLLPMSAMATALNLEAYTTGSVSASSTKPLDIVLVLDVSGSMAEGFKDGTATKTQVRWTWNSTLSDLDTLYVKIDQQYYPVTVNATTSGKGWNKTTTYTYSYSINGTTVTATSKDFDSAPDWDFYTDYYNTTNKLAALKAAANDFVDKVNKNAANNAIVHKIGVVSFSNSANIEAGMTDVSTSAGVTTVKDAINGLSAGGTTWIDDGLATAKTMFANDTSRNPDRVVVVFTDGIPGNGDWDDGWDSANSAIANAKDLKNNYNAKVFSIGILSGSDPNDSLTDTDDDALSNRMLNYISSNYPNATSMSAGGTGSNAGYYKAASSATELRNL